VYCAMREMLWSFFLGFGLAHEDEDGKGSWRRRTSEELGGGLAVSSITRSLQLATWEKTSLYYLHLPPGFKAISLVSPPHFLQPPLPHPATSQIFNPQPLTSPHTHNPRTPFPRLARATHPALSHIATATAFLQPFSRPSTLSSSTTWPRDCSDTAESSNDGIRDIEQLP